MGVIKRVVKPTTQQGKRALKDRAPKLIENEKKCLFINGQSTSNVGREFLKSLSCLKRTSSLYLSKKNPIMPFEDQQKVEWLSKKHDASLFAVTTHSKKRPNNIIFGRMFNNQVLDMVEVGVDESSFKSIFDIKNNKVTAGTKPCLIFSGVSFTESPEHVRFRSLLIDFFKGPTVKEVCLSGFELAIQFTNHENKIFMKTYRISRKNSGCEAPHIELVEIGPSAEMVLRRNKIATDDFLKSACKKPKQLKAKTKKNVSRTALGDTLGRVHMQKQDLGDLQVRKTPAIKKAKHLKMQQKKMEKNMANAVSKEV